MYEEVRSIFVFMENLGLVDVVLPLLIVFAVLYGVFEKTKVFGVENGRAKSRVNSIVALVIALMVVISINLVNLMTHIIWVFSTLIVLAIMILLLTGAFGIDLRSLLKKKEDKGK